MPDLRFGLRSDLRFGLRFNLRFDLRFVKVFRDQSFRRPKVFRGRNRTEEAEVGLKRESARSTQGLYIAACFSLLGPVSSIDSCIPFNLKRAFHPNSHTPLNRLHARPRDLPRLYRL